MPTKKADREVGFFMSGSFILRTDTPPATVNSIGWKNAVYF